MIWVYIVAMTLTAPITKDNSFIVHSPNMAFKTEKACQEWREYDMLRLYNSRPNEDAKAVSHCFSLPFNIDIEG
jgi:hypothetical protein